MSKKRDLFWLHFLVVIVLAIFVSRVTFVNFLMGDYYRSVAKNNTQRFEKVEHERGLILDRNEKQLAVNIEYKGKEIRFYPYGEVVGSLLGYVGKIDEETLKRCQPLCDGETQIGRMGLGKCS